MSTRISRVGYDSISTSKPAKSNSGVGSIATYRTYICLTGIKKLEYLCGSHTLDFINKSGPLVITIRFISLIGMPFCITTHKVGDLYTLYSLARRIFAGDQVDCLCLPPSILFCYYALNVADFDCHISSFVRCLLLKYVIKYSMVCVMLIATSKQLSP